MTLADMSPMAFPALTVGTAMPGLILWMLVLVIVLSFVIEAEWRK